MSSTINYIDENNIQPKVKVKCPYCRIRDMVIHEYPNGRIQWKCQGEFCPRGCDPFAHPVLSLKTKQEYIEKGII